MYILVTHLPSALLYTIWNNGYPQPAMGYYLKVGASKSSSHSTNMQSFNKKPYPVPGKHYTVAQINNRK